MSGGQLTRGERRRLTLLLVPIVALTVSGIVADWLAPALIVDHPAVEIALNPRLRYLMLASPQLGATTFYVLAFVRLVLSDPLYFLLGWWFGDAALRWMERRLGNQVIVRTSERWFRKAAYPLVAIAPNGFICLLAGASGMRPALFITLNVAGTIARLVAVRLAAAALAAPLDTLLRGIRRYRWWLLAVSVTLGAVQLARARRRGRGPETPGEIAAEIEGELSPGDR